MLQWGDNIRQSCHKNLLMPSEYWHQVWPCEQASGSFEATKQQLQQHLKGNDKGGQQDRESERLAKEDAPKPRDRFTSSLAETSGQGAETTRVEAGQGSPGFWSQGHCLERKGWSDSICRSKTPLRQWPEE